VAKKRSLEPPGSGVVKQLVIGEQESGVPRLSIYHDLPLLMRVELRSQCKGHDSTQESRRTRKSASEKVIFAQVDVVRRREQRIGEMEDSVGHRSRALVEIRMYVRASMIANDDHPRP
jgi:hypothetical protein